MVHIKEKEMGDKIMNIKGFHVSKIKIYGLFSEKKVEVDFSNEVQIFIGENGIGKTTILNIIYNSLTLNFEKLKELPFELIQMFFENGKSIMLSKKWIENDIKEEIYSNSMSPNDYYAKRIAEDLKLYEDIDNKVEKNRLFDIDSLKQFRYRKKEIIDSDIIFNELDSVDKKLFSDAISEEDIYIEYIGDETPNYYYIHNEIEIQEKRLRFSLYCYIINNFLKDNIIYFPTYRRIEEDLSKFSSELYLEIDDSIEEEQLISFGLSDVQNLIDKIEKEIREFNLEGYSQINGQLLNYMLNPKPITNEMLNKIKDKKSVEIILDRMEETTLKPKEKEILIEKLETTQFLESRDAVNEVIIYFIYQLIERYEMKREQEGAIKEFVKVCNKYLINKEFTYNQSKIKVEVRSKETNRKIELKNLSSGEKQIISAFAKIYLQEHKEKYLIIFDEPELSLSVEWQMMFLPDILISNQCSKIIAVTHSPFIYRNELKRYARSLENLITKTPNIEKEVITWKKD